MENRKIPQMRTINQAYQILKDADPESGISQYFIRQLVITGKVKHAMTGNKYLVNMDALVDYLSNPSVDDQIS